MQIPQKWLFRVAATVLLLLLVLGGVRLFNTRLLTPQTAQENVNPVVMAQETPVATLDVTPAPVIIIGTVEPTPTIIPTWTPLPTPTRLPGPTETPLPLSPIAQDNRGAIHYMIDDTTAEVKEQRHLFLTTNANGDVEGTPQPANIPEKLGFVPFQVFASPNKQYTVYMQAVEPGGRPYIHNQTTGDIAVLFENYSGGTFLGWHPDGHRFLFWIDSVGLWLIDAGTLAMVTLAYPTGPLQGAAISPDGLTVAYIAEGESNSGDALWLVSTAGSDAKPLSITEKPLYLYRSAWSPDSTQLLYYGVCKTATEVQSEVGAAGLCVINVKTQEQKALDLPYTGFAAVWSPNGRSIAATGTTLGQEACQPKTPEFTLEKCLYQARTIYVADLETGKSSALTAGINPVWSPDGSTLAFLSNRSGNSEIWAIKLDTQTTYQLTAGGQLIVPDSVTWMAEGVK